MTQNKSTLNDTAWEQYIHARNLTLDGRSIPVSATDLKDVTGREPRLLTKFDTPEAQPRLLREAGYSLLPTENGMYLLFHGDVFQPVPQCLSVGQAVYTLPFPLLTAGRGIGEMQYLDHAYNLGILGDFTGVHPLFLTIRGRERSSAFDFNVNGFPINVDGVQIEVDGGYEGKREIILVEAKIGVPQAFNIRQLYYPYRRFRSLVPNKRIRPIFLSYDVLRQTYSFYEFQFTDPFEFRSLELVRCQTYELPTARITRIDELQDVRYETHSKIVPQADDLSKVLQVVELVNEGSTSSQEIALNIDFVQRQGDYYKEAAAYLGLIARTRGSAQLTPHGLELIDAPIQEQLTILAKLIVNSWVFQALTQIARAKGHFAYADVYELVEHADPRPGKRYTGDTIGRRTDTILAWVRWLAERIGCYERDVSDPNMFRLL